MAEKRKFEERKQKHTKLKQLWEERGMVKFEQKFDTISDSVARKIKNKIKKLENDYKIAYEGSIPRVSDGTYHMKNVNATDEARLLLLSSGNNSLAEAIKEHLRIRYDAALLEVAKKKSANGSLQSILSQIDNVPSGYKVGDFSKQLAHFVVENRIYLSKTLSLHLRKMDMSYADMANRLIQEKSPGTSVDFVVAAASVMLDIPILMVRPTQHKVVETGRVYYEFHEIRAMMSEQHLPVHKHKIFLMFNGIDTFVPFMKTEIASIFNVGVSAMRQVVEAYTSVKELLKDIPNQTVLKNSVSDIFDKLKAATKIGAKTKFTCGATIDYPEKTPDAVPKTVNVRKRKIEQSVQNSLEMKKRRTDSAQPAEPVEASEQENTDSPNQKDKGKNCDRAPNQCHCGVKFDNSDDYNAHLNGKHKNELWMCSFDGCREICSKRSSLWAHYRRKHEKRYHNYCGVGECPYGSDEAWSVTKHKYEDHQIPIPEENKCPRCAKPFGQKSKLTRHLLTCNTDDYPFPCAECNKKFRQKDSLMRHKRQDHPKAGENTEKYFFVCHVCGTKYKSPSGLAQHKCLGPLSSDSDK